jgi:hypothetical protein
MRESASDSPLDQAVKRLDRAISQLEQRLAGSAGAAGGGLFDQDGAKLAAELEKAKVREKELEEAGAEASAALGRAISEIKAALGGQPATAQETEEA